MITNDVRCTRGIKSRIPLAKTAFNKKNAIFTSKFWNIAFYGAENLTIRKVDQKSMECFEIWCSRRVEKISWTDRVGNEV